MEELFKPRQGDSQTGIYLCIFPHLKEFLAFDVRGEEAKLMLVSIEDCFGEEFFRDVESEFSEILRDATDFPFAHLINLPVQIDELVREVAMTHILERLGVRTDQEEELPGVTVYVVGGGGLATHPDMVLEGLKEMLRFVVETGDPPIQWDQKIGEMIGEESAILERLNRQQVVEAIRGDSPDYFSLWENRN